MQILETMILVLEALVVVVSVIGLLWSGIWIGREFGSFEAFLVALIELLLEKVDDAADSDRNST